MIRLSSNCREVCGLDLGVFVVVVAVVAVVVDELASVDERVNGC